MTISPSYLALAGTICVGVGAQVLFKIGATGVETTIAQLLRVSTIIGFGLSLASVVLYVIVLRQMSQSIAFPTVSRRSPADELFNSVDLSRRNRDGNEEMHRQINDEARRLAANVAKLPELLQALAKRRGVNLHEPQHQL